MAYNQNLADQVESILNEFATPNTVGKKMFGGVGYLVNGNMACGVLGDKFIVRVGKDAYPEALERHETSVFDTRGRPMTGWVFVDPGLLEASKSMADWLRQGVDFALSLPPK